jgi:hypothetical protein
MSQQAIIDYWLEKADQDIASHVVGHSKVGGDD